MLGINNRGSSGYGQTFFTADDRKHGREPLRDCVDGKKYLAVAAVHRPRPHRHHRRQLRRLHGPGGARVPARRIRRRRRHLRRLELGAHAREHPALLGELPRRRSTRRSATRRATARCSRAISPVFHADKIKKPLLVLQGENDPRVIKPESDDIVAAVKKNGVPVEYVVFPDEGHGFTKKKNQIEGYRAVLEVPRSIPEERSGDRVLRYWPVTEPSWLRVGWAQQNQGSDRRGAAAAARAGATAGPARGSPGAAARVDARKRRLGGSLVAPPARPAPRPRAPARPCADRDGASGRSAPPGRAAPRCGAISGRSSSSEPGGMSRRMRELDRIDLARSRSCSTTNRRSAR